MWDYKIGILNKDSDFVRDKNTACGYIIGDKFNGSYSRCSGCDNSNNESGFSCYFKYGNRLQESVSSTQPSRTYDGKYERYSCPSTFSSCSSAETVKNHCTPA